MKNLFLLFSITIISCCSAKKIVDSGNDHKSLDTVVVTSNPGNNYEADAKLPACIKRMIRQFKEEEKQNYKKISNSFFLFCYILIVLLEAVL